jgi:hypothetical protein
MPPITIILSETEATHVRELCERDHEVCQFGLTNSTNPDIRFFYEAIDSINVLLLEKLKDF